jgi:hypothetical protein
MEPSEQLQPQSKSRIRVFLEKLVKKLYCAEQLPEDPNRVKSAQEIREDLLSKCLWKDPGKL